MSKASESGESGGTAKRVLFGTDGVRGKANIHPMTCEVAMALGRAVTAYFQNKRKNHVPLIIIGKDTRLSCYMLEQAFSSGVCSQGGKAILTGPLPTPGVAFVTTSMRADAGVMISASHNSFSDNGIKIFDHTGHKLPDEVELELERMILHPSEVLITKVGGDLGSAQRLDEVIGRYIVFVKSAFNSQYSLEKKRFVVDCAHGAAYKVAPMIFRELGAEVITLGNTPNGKNINEYCGAVHPQLCAEQVIKYRADLGICLDGDADRVCLIDHTGQVVNGDLLIGLAARFLYDSGGLDRNKEVVGTIMSNLGLENYLRDYGMSFVRTQVGDRYIVERMCKSGALFGGEPSGHLIFKNYSTTGDGILAALKIIEAMIFYNKSLADLTREIPLYPQVMRNVVVKNRPPLESVLPVAEEIEKAQQQLGDKGRMILRYSGTEPLVRIMVEGENRQLIKQVCERMAAVVAEHLK